MKIAIEVLKGCVTGVYISEPWPISTRVFVVDLDGVQVGESTEAIPITPEPLEDASDIILDALPES